MVWTEITLNGRTDLYVFARGHTTATQHCHYIREPIVRSYAGAIVYAFILMQDNARAHTARVSLTFFDDDGISVMNWPTSSADLNPIEHRPHTWGILSRRIRQRPHHPGNVENLIGALVQELQENTTQWHQEDYTTSLTGVWERYVGGHIGYW